jgi:molecular chaperone DnaK (HSP70)
MDYLAGFIPDIVNFREVSRPVRVLGIDLGTSNSTIAGANWIPGSEEPIHARCIEVDQFTYEGTFTHVLVPSVVALWDGKVLVGEGAKRLVARSAEFDLERNKHLFYECKNDVGLKKTYRKAPEGFRTAAEIGGKVLEFLHLATLAEDETPVDRVVVTVPASFQAAQRNDILKAAGLAGLELEGGDLLDEPVAAFLDYIIANGEKFTTELDEPKILSVFDFGGGTCDVAIFSLKISRRQGRLEVSPLAVSRYHRLGGGDIDRAILYEILMPQIMEQNHLTDFALEYKEKRDCIEPAFLGLAEALKIALCKQIARLKAFKKYEQKKSEIVARQPGIYECKLENGTVTLQSPALTAEQFESLLDPFLEKDLLYPRETEYRWTCSIFAPLQDALDRCNLDAKQVDYCLLVGGSSIIPQVVEAVAEYFPRSEILNYPDWDSIQTAVARGAAYHALARSLCGRGLAQPVCHDAISIRTNIGLQELVSRGATLPYPGDGSYARLCSLTVPETVLLDFIKLRVEIVGGMEERLLFYKIWNIGGPVNKGEPLTLEYRYTEDQILELRMYLTKGDPADFFPVEIENPLTNVVNPQSKRVKIDEMEEGLFVKGLSQEQKLIKLVELADLYADLGQYEKAVHYLKVALRGKGSPDEGILNKIGIYCGKMGDYKGEEKFYQEAAGASSWDGPIFNLALSQRRRKLHSEAVVTLEKALAGNREAPYLVLRAMLAEDLNDTGARDKFLNESLIGFNPVKSLSDWELSWFLTAANMAGDSDKIIKAKEEQKTRQRNDFSPDMEEGILPGGPILPVRV